MDIVKQYLTRRPDTEENMNDPYYGGVYSDNGNNMIDDFPQETLQRNVYRYLQRQENKVDVDYFADNCRNINNGE